MTRLSKFLCFAVTTACCAQPMFGQTREAESKKVYSAVFDSLFRMGSVSPSMIVLQDSTNWEAGNVVFKGRMQLAHTSQIGQEVIDDFGARAAPPVALTASSFSYSKPIAFV